MNKVQPPSKKQLQYCYDILKRVKECPADEYGQPLFEKSMTEADKYIKQHSQPATQKTECSAEDWGGIPNH